VAPGVYNLNPVAFTAFLVPTSAVTVDWASGSELRAEHKTGVLGVGPETTAQHWRKD